MIDLDSAVAHAVLQRASILGGERRTADAQHLVRALQSPAAPPGGLLLGRVQSHPAIYGLGAVVRERADLRLVYLLLKEGRAGELAEANQLADSLLERVGPQAETATLDGEARTSFLSDLATALSNLCRENEAIELTNFLIRLSGTPDVTPAVLARFLETEDARPHVVRITQQLQNNAMRHLRLAQLDLAAGNQRGAGDQLALAREEIGLSLDALQRAAVTTEHDRVRSMRLVRARRAIAARIELEAAALIDDPARRDDALGRIRTELEAVVAETDAARTSSPPIRLLRYAALGSVIAEQSLSAERADDETRARQLGRLAYILIAPYAELHERDADERFSYIVRYGHALRLIGRTVHARAVLQRSRDRLALYYPERHDVLDRFDQLLDRVSTA